MIHVRRFSIDRVAWTILLLAIVLLIVVIRIRLLAIPLERDEGEYAYAGQLMLSGIAPYKLAYNMKFPGTYAAYAAGMALFGQSTIGIHLLLLTVNVLTIGLVFLLARRLFGFNAGCAAAATYALTSVSPSTLGFAGHATHFVVACGLAGALLLLSSADSQSLLRIGVSSVFFGAAVLMKQPGAAFAVFALLYLLVHLAIAKRSLAFTLSALATFGAGLLLPLAATALWLWLAGVFDRFWFWSLQYARVYGTNLSVTTGWDVFTSAIGSIIGSSVGFWLIGGIGVIAVSVWRFELRTKLFVLGLTVFSWAAVCAGFYFRPHYFILFLPSIALLTGGVVAAAQSYKTAHLLTFIAVVLACALCLTAERDFFFWLPMGKASRLTSGPNPFPEAVRVGEFLREKTGPSDTIAVVGSEPEIYFYARRHSATGYIYTYGLMEAQPFAVRMQREMAAEIEAARPKYVVFVAVDKSWLAQPGAGDEIFRWFEQYSQRELQPIGVVNIVSAQQTDYYLPYHGEAFTPAAYRLLVYERKL